MKIIKYKICDEIDGVQLFTDKTITCPSSIYEDNLAIVQKEAYNGEYTVEDDGIEEVIEPTAQDDTDAMLVDHEYRLTLLELGIS